MTNGLYPAATQLSAGRAPQGAVSIRMRGLLAPVVRTEAGEKCLEVMPVQRVMQRSMTFFAFAGARAPMTFQGPPLKTPKFSGLLRQIESFAGCGCPRLRSPWVPNERVRRGLARQEVTAPLELPPEAHNSDQPSERAN